MSYSVSANGKTKAEALAALLQQFDDVVKGQPVHAADMDKCKTAAESFVALLSEPGDGEQIAISANGYLSWNYNGDNSAPTKDFQSASFNVTASVSKQ